MTKSFFLSIESLVGLIVMLFVGASLASSQPAFGRIIGRVRDSSGASLANCVITVEKAGTSFRRSTMADAAASYVFRNLEPGVYKVTMMAPGFQVTEYTDIRLFAHQSIRIDGQMIAASESNIRGRAIRAGRLRPRTADARAVSVLP